MKLYAIWPVGDFGEVTMVVANSREDALCWLENFWDKTHAKMIEEAKAEGWIDDDVSELTIVEHEIVHGLCFGDLSGRGYPEFLCVRVEDAA